MQFKPLQREDKSEKVSTQFFTRYASKRYINNYQVQFGAINAVILRFEEKKSINLISKWGYPNIHALKINKQNSKMTTTASEVDADVVLLYKLIIYQSLTFLIKIYNILKNNILKCSCWASVES